MPSSPPLSPYSSLWFPDRARTSCADLQNNNKNNPTSLPAWTDMEACQAFAKTLNADTVRQEGRSLATNQNETAMKGQFASTCQEAGLILLMHALDFGGGWRQELHAFHQKGAFATVKPGVEQLFKAQPNLTASWLAELTNEEVAQRFGLVGATALEPLVESLTNVCNEVGKEIVAAGYETMGDFMDAQINAVQSAERPAAQLVQILVETFPFTFRDVYVIQDKYEVYFYKKAQLVVGELGHRFGQEDQRYAFSDQDQLTAYIDNVIVAVLRKHGVVATVPELQQAIESHTHLPQGSLEEVSLRAAAMTGVEVTSTLLNLSPCELGNYLWGCLGKQPDHRTYQRHATKDTVFY